MESPDPVSRVMPPITTMAKTMAAQANSQIAIARFARGAGISELGGLAVEAVMCGFQFQSKFGTRRQFSQGGAPLGRRHVRRRMVGLLDSPGLAAMEQFGEITFTILTGVVNLRVDGCFVSGCGFAIEHTESHWHGRRVHLGQHGGQ